MVVIKSITLPCIFGGKSKDVFLSGKDIVINLYDGYFTTRTNYQYRDAEDFTDCLVNEKSYYKKSAIEHIGIAYSNESDVYFISFKGIALDTFINIESAEKANEVLEIFINWWLN